jgi:hypothetical protein
MGRPGIGAGVAAVTRAGYHAHPSRNLAGAGERRWLDRLPCSCAKWRMRVPSVSQIRPWVLAPMKRFVVSVGAAQAGERDRRRRRGHGPAPTRVGARERCASPPGQRPATLQQAPEAPLRRSAEATPRCEVAAVVASSDRPRRARDRSALGIPPASAGSGGADSTLNSTERRRASARK